MRKRKKAVLWILVIVLAVSALGIGIDVFVYHNWTLFGFAACSDGSNFNFVCVEKIGNIIHFGVEITDFQGTFRRINPGYVYEIDGNTLKIGLRMTTSIVYLGCMLYHFDIPVNVDITQVVYKTENGEFTIPWNGCSCYPPRRWQYNNV
ncbi:MAG: hypothetical protein IKA51_00690 [Clostridia bacterium]|nr:hypothetical protein [Clostridia bacterium]